MARTKPVVMTVGEIIDSLGGTTQVASALSVGKSTVSSWRARAAIPPEYWSALVKMGDGNNSVTLEQLAALAARPAEARA